MDDSTARKKWLQGLVDSLLIEHQCEPTNLAYKMSLSPATVLKWRRGEVDPDGFKVQQLRGLAEFMGRSLSELQEDCDRFVDEALGRTSPKHDAPDRVPGADEMIQSVINRLREAEVELRIVQAHVSQSHKDIEANNSRLSSGQLLVSYDTSERSNDDLATAHLQKLINRICEAQNIYQEEFLQIATAIPSAQQEIALALRMGLQLSGDQLGAIAYGLQQLGYQYDAGELARIQNDSTNQHC